MTQTGEKQRMEEDLNRPCRSRVESSDFECIRESRRRVLTLEQLSGHASFVFLVGRQIKTKTAPVKTRQTPVEFVVVRYDLYLGLKNIVYAYQLIFFRRNALGFQ